MGLDILYLLIPASALLALAALGFFLWAIRNGQFDDLETPAIRMLFEERPAAPGERKEQPGSIEPNPPAPARK